MTTITIEEHGIMLPDYFQGTGGVWINVPVSADTTCCQVIDFLESEINGIWDHIEYTANYHGVPEEVWETALKEEIQRMRDYVYERNTGDERYAKGVKFEEDEDGMSENPVAIFTIEFEQD